MLLNPCPWTAAAYASEEHSKRARAAAHDVRRLAATIDPLFPTVIQESMDLADAEDSMADSLVWLRDFAIFAAQHPAAVAAFRRSIENGEPPRSYRRATGRITQTTKPAGDGEATVLRVVKGGLPG